MHDIFPCRNFFFIEIFCIDSARTFLLSRKSLEYRCMNFFLGHLLRMNFFFSRNFPLHEFSFVLRSPPPPPITFLVVRPQRRMWVFDVCRRSGTLLSRSVIAVFITVLISVNAEEINTRVAESAK